MTPERWQKVRDVLGQVLELAPERRSEFLDCACDSDSSLRSEVESLLSSDENARSSFLQSPPIPAAALTKGTRLGDYEIVSLVGSGGMGEVYRARDTKLKREVAIKVLPPYWSRDPERLERFELEARAAAVLNHPNITSIFHVGQHNGSPYIVTELLQGETLRERLRRAPLRLREALDFGVEIARGLGAAHDAGVIHRDLKPENIYVTKDGRIKILDFGLAKLQVPKSAKPEDPTVIPRRTNPGQVLGTVGYMSPEQVRGQSTDARSDIFAAGAVLYEMLTGKPAFRKGTSAETMSAILNEDPPAISQVAPNLPPGLQRIVNRCLAKNPDQRFQHAADLAFAIEALSDSAVTTPSDSHATAREIWGRKRIAVVAVAALVVLGAVLFAYWRLRPEPPPKISNYVQLTHDGQQKNLLGTDGARIYLYITSPDYRGIAEIPTSGGEWKKLPILPSARFSPLGLSPDGSEILVAESGADADGPLWIFPLIAGSPRRLGNLVGQSANWSPDAKLIGYADKNAILVAKPDGSESRKVLALGETEFIFDVIWSPDQSHLRFQRQTNLDSPPRFWEVKLDGTGLHQLLPGWSSSGSYQECCGNWTIGGKYFVFRGRGEIWALPQKRSFPRSQASPIQLTASPLRLYVPVPSKDGKKLFVLGYTARGELNRYDLKSGKFEPFLGGISAEAVSFSKDGQWIAYVSYPDGALWRSKLDGTDKLQLTYPADSWSSNALNPRWSPDGKKIVFCQAYGDKPSRILEVSPEGGTPQPLLPEDTHPQTDPNWSPDGNKIIFSGNANNPASSIRILDLMTHQVSTLPGSQGLFSTRSSPDGRYIASLSADMKRLLLFDFQAQKWTEIAKSGELLGWPSFSDDGQFLQFLDSAGTGAVLRFRLSDHEMERIVDLKNFVYTGYYGGTWLAMAPDNAPLLLRDATTADIYSLDWEEP